MQPFEQVQVFSKTEKTATLESVFTNFLAQSQSCFRFYAYFHLLFISFLSLQVLSFLLFFSYFTKSMACASALALFFLTLFSYFVLLFFFQGKQPEQFLSIRNAFFSSYQSIFPKATYLELAQISIKGCEALSQEESTFYKKEAWLPALTSLLWKCKIRLCAKNYHTMKELFFSLSIEQVTAHIKQDPLDLEAHALLSEVYLKQATLYLLPSSDAFPWTPSEYFSPSFHQKFLSCSNRAIEECHVLQEYGEKNSWLFSQLAKIYELQENVEQEIQSREELYDLSPNDHEALFKLGLLYFKQGSNTKGLKIYQMLLADHPEEAAQLIEHYPFSPFENA